MEASNAIANEAPNAIANLVFPRQQARSAFDFHALDACSRGQGGLDRRFLSLFDSPAVLCCKRLLVQLCG